MAFNDPLSGKSLAASIKFIQRILDDLNALIASGPPSLETMPLLSYWVVAPQWSLLYQSQKYLKEFLKPYRAQWNNLQSEIYSVCHFGPPGFPNAVRISFRSAAVKDRLVSETVNGMLVDEAARLNHDTWSGELLGRLTATNGWAIAVSSPLGANWFYEQCFLPGLRAEDKAEDFDSERVSSLWRSFHWNSVDNPANDPAALESLRKTIPKARFAREYEANFNCFSGQVWEDFDPLVHVKKSLAEFPNYPETVLGIDWGYGHDGAFLVCGIDREKKRMGVLEEIIESGKDPLWWLERLVELAKRYPRLQRAICDGARPDLMATFRARQYDYFNGTGRLPVSMIPANKDVVEGCMVVGELFRTNSLLIHADCKVTIKEVTSYHWQLSRGMDGQIVELPEKKLDESCDCVRYIANTLLSRVNAHT